MHLDFKYYYDLQCINVVKSNAFFHGVKYYYTLQHWRFIWEWLLGALSVSNGFCY